MRAHTHTHIVTCPRPYYIGYSYTNTAGRVMSLFQLHPLPLTLRERESIINNRSQYWVRAEVSAGHCRHSIAECLIVQHWPYSEEAISDATESVLHLFVQQHMSVALFFHFGCLWIFCEQLQNSSSWQQMIWGHDMPASNFWSFRSDFRMVRQSSVAFVHPRCFDLVWQALAEVTRQKSCVQLALAVAVRAEPVNHKANAPRKAPSR